MLHTHHPWHSPVYLPYQPHPLKNVVTGVNCRLVIDTIQWLDSFWCRILSQYSKFIWNVISRICFYFCNEIRKIRQKKEVVKQLFIKYFYWFHEFFFCFFFVNFRILCVDMTVLNQASFFVFSITTNFTQLVLNFIDVEFWSFYQL